MRAVSSLYLERREEGGFSRALEGEGKRAAFATYYAPLHFLTAHHAITEIQSQASGWPADVRRVVDLGSGSGAVAAAAATALDAPPPAVLVDRSGWTLREARHTLRAFGLSGRCIRGSLPRELRAIRRGDLLCFGWVLNELPDGAREETLARIVSACASGARALILEPLAGGVSPWWDDACAQLAPAGLRSTVSRVRLALPTFLAKMDRAAGLDHRELGARVLYGPP